MAYQAVLGALGGMGGSLTELMPNYVGMGMNYLGTGLLTGNWGGTSKERKNVITDQRKLRKTAYQDQVYSLQKAGLNPILAVGAQPSHASASQVATAMNQNPQAATGPTSVGSAIAANRQAGVAERKAPSEIAQREVETQNKLISRAGILQQYDLNKANIELVRDNASASKALAILYGQQAINQGASADKTREELEQIRKFGLPGQSWEGLLRQFLTQDEGKGLNQNSARSFRERFNDAARAVPEIDYGR